MNRRDVTIWWPFHISRRFTFTAIHCEIAQHFPRSVVKVGLNLNAKISVEWNSIVNSDGFKGIIFHCIICEPFGS